MHALKAAIMSVFFYVLAAAVSSSPPLPPPPPPPPLCSPSSVEHECLYAGKVGLTQLRNFSCPDSGGMAACADACCHQCDLLPACQAWTVWGPGGRQKAKDNKCFLTHNNPGGPAPGTPGIPACLSGTKPPAPTHPPAPAPRGARNTLLFVVDDLRPQLGVYGQEFMITPNLDRLASEGVVFNRAYVQYAWCSPSRNSFLTGRSPDTLEIWNFGKSFRDTRENPPTGGGSPDMTVVPMPQYFKENGFLTLGGGKIYHPGQPPNDDVPYSWSADIPYLPFVHQNCPGMGNKSGSPGCGGCPQEAPDEEFYDWQLANHTIHSLRYAKTSGRPFFIGAGFRRPHVPWYINKRFVEMYDNITVFPPAHPTWATGQPPCAFICGGDGVGCDFSISQPRPVAETVLCRKTYYAAVTSTDHFVGLVLDELDALDLTHNTTVLIFGDHGWSLGEGDQWAKYTNLEFATRTPFILRAPWIPALAGSRSDAFAELLDVFPTLAELAGLPVPSSAEGKSLVPLLMNKSATVRTSASSQFAHCCGKGVAVNASSVCDVCGSAPSSTISYMGYTVRTAEWRWIEWHRWNGTVLRPECAIMATELYPHVGDDGLSFDSPYETVNVADSNPTVAQQLHTELMSRFTKAFAGC